MKTDVERLLVEGIKVLNRYSTLFHATTHSTDIVGRDDFRSVLEAVRDHLQMIERRVEEDIRRWEERS
jgi:predicted neutral ceramidase superfamily lipid hydrolase